MDPLLSRKHNSFSEAFAGYLANALRPSEQTRALVTIQKFPYPDTTIHVHKLMHRVPPSVPVVMGYVVFKFTSETEGITLLQLSPDDARHFAPMLFGNGHLNRNVIDRMIELLPEQVHVGLGAESWPSLRETFLTQLYGESS
jgi:hypothetical protein